MSDADAITELAERVTDARRRMRAVRIDKPPEDMTDEELCAAEDALSAALKAFDTAMLDYCYAAKRNPSYLSTIPKRGQDNIDRWIDTLTNGKGRIQ